MEQNLKQLKDIIAANQDLKGRVEAERWSISYNKEADMVLMGTKFPRNTFYYPVGDSGVLLRVDSKNRLYGYAIENAKIRIKENPEISLALSFVIHPYRTRFIIFPILFLVHQTARSINGMKSIFSVSDYVAGKAAFV